MIERLRGSAHPHFPDMIYPLDYGYLAGTSASDGGGIDVWVGSTGHQVVGVVTTINMLKRDAELKILIGCAPTEIETVIRFFQEHQIVYLPVLC